MKEGLPEFELQIVCSGAAVAALQRYALAAAQYIRYGQLRAQGALVLANFRARRAHDACVLLALQRHLIPLGRGIRTATYVNVHAHILEYAQLMQIRFGRHRLQHQLLKVVRLEQPLSGAHHIVVVRAEQATHVHPIHACIYFAQIVFTVRIFGRGPAIWRLGHFCGFFSRGTGGAGVDDVGVSWLAATANKINIYLHICKGATRVTI